MREENTSEVIDQEGISGIDHLKIDVEKTERES